MPDVYENFSGKIKNKKLLKIFGSDNAKIMVWYRLSYEQNRLK